jgi:uncharacterized protein (UPF0332 family)
MDPIQRLYLKKADNELTLAEMLFRISISEEIKSGLAVNKNQTFFSAVISHCYYSIFYCAKAYLLSKGINPKLPSVHSKVYNEFEKFVQSGALDKQLLKIYDDARIKAEYLLNILFKEAKKRGQFTYEKLPGANEQPARDSLENSKKFFKTIYNILHLQV